MAEYIKREAAIKRIKEVYCAGCNSYNGVRCRACGTGDAIDMIEDAPAADVAPVVHGRWISWEKAGNFVPSPDRHECSVCHDAAQVLVNGFELLSDYCPNCGAKMDGERKDGGADHEAD